MNSASESVRREWDGRKIGREIGREIKRKIGRKAGWKMKAEGVGSCEIRDAFFSGGQG